MVNVLVESREEIATVEATLQNPAQLRIDREQIGKLSMLFAMFSNDEAAVLFEDLRRYLPGTFLEHLGEAALAGDDIVSSGDGTIRAE
jgi:hypothetical protein